MPNELRITTLIENHACQDNLAAEHGLSFWIEYAGKQVLFDTGQSDGLIQNAQTLGVHLEKTDAIVISHGHYDHTGGLSAVLHWASKATIYMHPAALERKFSQKTSGAQSIGMSESTKRSIQGRPIVWTTAPAPIFPGISVTGQVPRLNHYEDVGGAFFMDEDCRCPDTLLDDQSLFIQTAKGLVVVFGCAHAGVVNTLNYIRTLTDNANLYAVIGGMHLLHASPIRIAKTIETFIKYEMQKIIPLHCTGQTAIETMEKALGDKCVHSGAGGQFSF